MMKKIILRKAIIEGNLSLALSSRYRKYGLIKVEKLIDVNESNQLVAIKPKEIEDCVFIYDDGYYRISLIHAKKQQPIEVAYIKKFDNTLWDCNDRYIINFFRQLKLQQILSN